MLHNFETDMVSASKRPTTNIWLVADWDEYIQNVERHAYKKAKGYYHNDKYRIEMTPIGNEHSQDHSIINHAIYLYATLKNIPFTGKDNCSYRQIGLREFQPDLSCYVDKNANVIPWGVGIVNLDEYPVPDLVIEISNTSLVDDLGSKRLLYEDVGIAEYWIIDVQNIDVIAFAIKDRGSKRITESQVLAGLKLEVLTEALKRSRSNNHTVVASWLMQQFQT